MDEDANSSDAAATARVIDVPSGARCIGCHYALNELTLARCPECGQPFDPADRGTMNFGRHVPPLARCLFRPANWLPSLAACVGWSGVVISPFITQNLFASSLILAAWFLIIPLLYVPRAVARNWLVLLYGQPASFRNVDDDLGRRAGRRFVLPCLLAIFHVPFLACWAVSHHWLHRVAYDTMYVIPAVQEPRSPRFCGVFPLWSVDANAAGVRFTVPLGGTIVYRQTDDGKDMALNWRRTFISD